MNKEKLFKIIINQKDDEIMKLQDKLHSAEFELRQKDIIAWGYIIIIFILGIYAIIQEFKNE